ncbi:MAG: carbohydrate kinase [Gemmataceae bacterium]
MAEIIGLGEILWDLLPAGRQPGGAPFNFAFHCHQFGHSSLMISRVGDDDLGRDLREAVRRLGLADDCLQVDPAQPTGTVTVALDGQGQPTFTIHEHVAYDYLEWTEGLEPKLAAARAVCFGTLIQRAPAARATVRRALESAGRALLVYDVNLRQRFYSREIIADSLRISHWAKLNDEELAVLTPLLGLSGKSASDLLADLRRRYELEVVALTRGAAGCLVQTKREEVDLPGIPVGVADTVGAGDAFTAALLTYTLEGRNPAESAFYANQLAARVASLPGGTPTVVRVEFEREAKMH